MSPEERRGKKKPDGNLSDPGPEQKMHKYGPVDPTGAVTSGIQTAPMRDAPDDSTRPVAPTEDDGKASVSSRPKTRGWREPGQGDVLGAFAGGRDDLIPVEQGRESKEVTDALGEEEEEG